MREHASWYIRRVLYGFDRAPGVLANEPDPLDRFMRLPIVLVTGYRLSMTRDMYITASHDVTVLYTKGPLHCAVTRNPEP